MLNAHDGFIGRGQIIHAIHDFVTRRDSGTLLLEAEPGTGKSALIARCIRHEFKATTPWLAYYLYHCGEGLTDPTACLRTLYQLVRLHAIEDADPLEVGEQPRKLSVKLHRLLTKHVAPRLDNNRQLIFIDSLDEARTGGELTAYQALPDQLPHGVFVIATSRAIPERTAVLSRRERIERVNLNAPDYATDNLRDTRQFVAARLRGHSLAASIQEEICQVGAGNFLVLREICRWVRDRLLPGEVAGFLKQLPVAPEGPLWAIYDEFWGRIAKAALDEAARVAGLILETQGSADAALALESGVVSRRGWEEGIDHLSEYLRKIDGDDGRSSYRVYHQSFADFLRTRVDWEAQQARQALAKMCVRWRELSGDLRRYAVQFGPEHLCRAEQWSDLEKLLTDLEFVEEKCKQGMVIDLSADYQQVSEQHPAWLEANTNERQRRKMLTEWSAGVMRAGKQWSDKVKDAWKGDEGVKAQQQLVKPSYPDPPDTSELADLLRGRRRDELLNTPIWSDSVRQLESYRSFVIRFGETLQRHPEAVLTLAANCRTPGTLSQSAEQLLIGCGSAWIEERPRLDLGVGMIPLPIIRATTTADTISADGMHGATGDADGNLLLWDLVTGRCLFEWKSAHQSAVARVILSVDGSRLISAGVKGSIRVHDCRGPYRELGSEELACNVVSLDCSPEGSIIAVACRDNLIRMLDGDSDQLTCKQLRTSDDLGEVAWVRCWPEQSLVLAGNKEDDCHGWHLVTGQHAVLPEKVEAVGQFLCVGDFVCSADRRIKLREGTTIYVDDEETKTFGDYPPEWVEIVADGRVVWSGDSDTFRGVDLLARETIEELDPPSMWSDRGRGEPKTEDSWLIAKYGYLFNSFDEPPDALSRVLFSRLVEEPPEDRQCAWIKDDRADRKAFSALTSDFRISIDISRVADVPTDSLYRIPLPEVDEVRRKVDEIKFVQVSPCGQRAFLSLPGQWIVWDIRTGERIADHDHDSSDVSVVMPDWKCAASIVDGSLMLVDLSTGRPIVDTPLDSSGKLYVTPDGRRLIVSTTGGIALWSIAGAALSKSPFPPLEHSTVSVVTPDAELLICEKDDHFQVYELATGKRLVSQLSVRCPLQLDKLRIDAHGTIVADWIYDLDDETILRQQIVDERQLKIRTPSESRRSGPPFVTATRVFRYNSDDESIQTAFYSGQPLPGDFDLRRTVVCNNCGKRFPLPESAEGAINAVIDSANLSPDLSPCLHLPTEAWDVPGLRCQWEHCKAPLRLNPFVAFVV